MEAYISILLVEDDENLGFITKDGLEDHGFHVSWAKDGQEAYEVFQSGKFDICILDVMLPKKDGFTLGKDIRKINTEVPIFYLTAKGLQQDKIEGLEIGADDYITKPFDMKELCLRIDNILKRTKFSDELGNKEVFQLGKIVFNSKELTLTHENEVQKLTKKESELLRLLCIHQDEVLERDVALRIVWGDDDYFLGRSMDVFITKLRKYLKVDPAITITNVHGVGFKLEVA
tara:strand:+ start:1717 stop:2409 length:693 start_codon:yes stop_codon:yes gene_type:complete